MWNTSSIICVLRQLAGVSLIAILRSFIITRLSDILIVPHICRTLFGSDARYLLPTSALLGASFVLICDIIGRLIAAPYELPAGIIMAFIGGPFFMYLLLKKKGGRRINA